jgi:hypothetical protein
MNVNDFVTRHGLTYHSNPDYASTEDTLTSEEAEDYVRSTHTPLFCTMDDYVIGDDYRPTDQPCKIRVLTYYGTDFDGKEGIGSGSWGQCQPSDSSLREFSEDKLIGTLNGLYDGTVGGKARIIR